MDNKFIFEYGEPKSFRKYCNIYYAIYKNILPDLTKISNEMYKIEKEYIVPKNDNQIDMSLSESVNLSRKIINYYLGLDYEKIFDKLIIEDRIKFYDGKNEILRMKY